MNKQYNILICPLEWGLGHAGRMIALARILQNRGNNIFIGAGKEHLSLFREEMSGVSYVDFPGFRPAYSRFLPQYLALLLRLPSLIYHIIAEHNRIKALIFDHNIDIVISDNRFGLWNKKIKTVYVTHQPLIPFPGKLKFLEWTGISLHRWIIKKYSYCFIPDLPSDLNISGRLTHGISLPENARFIGILSRFSNRKNYPEQHSGDFPHNTVVLSGPEPQRGMLRETLAGLLQDKELPTVFLEGRPGENGKKTMSGSIISYNHLLSSAMQNIIAGSEDIITRPGYTMIMELVSMNRGALLIPTPGQTEQEYLAIYLSGKGWFKSTSQKSLEQGLNLPGRLNIPGQEIISESRKLLDKALDELLS